MCGAKVSALMLLPPRLLASAAKSLPTQAAACLSISDWQFQYTCCGSSWFNCLGTVGCLSVVLLAVLDFFAFRLSLVAAELVALRFTSPIGFLRLLGIRAQQ